MRIALGQPGLGDFEDITAGNEEVAADFAQYLVPATSVAPTATAQPASSSIVDSIVGLFTSKPVATALVNKVVFGQNTPVGVAPVIAPGTPGYIMGIPTSYVMIAGAAVAALVLMKKKR